MKNIVKLFSLFIISTLIYWGCSSTTEPDPDPEVVELLTDGMWEICDSNGIIDTTESRGRYKYNSDYTGVMYMMWVSPEGEWEISATFTWKLEDSSIKLVYSSPSQSGSVSATIEKLTDTELILFWLHWDMRQYYTNVPDQAFLF